MMNELILLAIANMENEADQIFIADLYEQHYELMKSKAFGYVDNIHDAEDVVQNAYFKLIKNVSTLKKLTCCTLASYIVYTIESVSMDWLRSKKRHTNLLYLYGDDDAVDDIPDIETPEDIFLQKYDALEVREALDKLKSRFILILKCKYFQEMSDKEIAEIVNIKPSSVRTYLTRARNELREILEKEYDIHGSQ